MKTVIEGVLSGALPWGLVGTGAALSLSAMLAGLPGLSFAVGIYLPLATLTPIFVGGLVRRVVEARRAGVTPETDPGVLASSGMIAGEGLAGVAIAFLVAARTRWPEAGWSELLGRMHFAERGFTVLSGPVAAAVGLAVLAALCGLLYRAGPARHAVKWLRERWQRGRSSEDFAWACLLANVVGVPGLGTLMARRWEALPQLTLSITSGVLLTWWLVAFAVAELRTMMMPPPGGPAFALALLGLGLFALGWVWALFSSLAFFRSVRRSGAAVTSSPR